MNFCQMFGLREVKLFEFLVWFTIPNFNQRRSANRKSKHQCNPTKGALKQYKYWIWQQLGEYAVETNGSSYIAGWCWFQGFFFLCFNIFLEKINIHLASEQRITKTNNRNFLHPVPEHYHSHLDLNWHLYIWCIPYDGMLT